jgi:hypothetical protein
MVCFASTINHSSANLSFALNLEMSDYDTYCGAEGMCRLQHAFFTSKVNGCHSALAQKLWYLNRVLSVVPRSREGDISFVSALKNYVEDLSGGITR